MIKITSYLNDGANWQSKAVMYYIQDEGEFKKEETPYIARWDNFGEQGYVLSVHHYHRRFSICFFQHKNTDVIYSFWWVDEKLVTPCKYNITNLEQIFTEQNFYVSYGEIIEMGNFIIKKIKDFCAEQKK